MRFPFNLIRRKHRRKQKRVENLNSDCEFLFSKLVRINNCFSTFRNDFFFQSVQKLPFSSFFLDFRSADKNVQQIRIFANNLFLECSCFKFFQLFSVLIKLNSLVSVKFAKSPVSRIQNFSEFVSLN